MIPLFSPSIAAKCESNRGATAALRIAVTALLLLVCGCSHSGYHPPGARLDTSRSVYVPGDGDTLVVSDSESHRTQIVAMLESHGYHTSPTNSPGFLKCRISHRPGITLHTVATLQDGDQVVARGEARNSGWGTAIAADTATAANISSAIKALGKELSDIQAGKEWKSTAPALTPRLATK